jgi:hypothetical protein
VIQQVLGAAFEGVRRVVQPQAAGVIAAEFGFPLVLTLAVIGFLVVQSRVDHRDPKLRLAPQSTVETIVKFKEESEL